MADDDRTSKTQEKAPAPTMGWNPAYALALADSQHDLQSWMRGTMSLSQELAAFVQERAREDIAAWIRLLACRSYDEVLDVQCRFFENAARQYVEEIGTLSRRMIGIADDTLYFEAAAAKRLGPGS